MSLSIAKVYELADQIGLLTFSTMHQGEVHSRIAHFNGYDEEGIYFRTMGNKPYGRQLKETLKVTVCGHFGQGVIHGEVGALPEFAPGYSLRIIGEIRYVAPEEIKAKAQKNKMLEVAARDIELYPAMAEGNFIIHKAKVEIFDYDFAKIHRDHKVLRTRWAWGGMSYNPAGVSIDQDRCIGCGACEDICSFDAISSSDGSFRVIGERCDDCGSCLQACPVDAINLSKTF